MAKDKSDKKEKKEKRSEVDGVKKSKKDKKSSLNGHNVEAALAETLKESDKAVVKVAEDVNMESAVEVVIKPVGALVPFANPLADDKVAKKVLKSVKKGRASQFRLITDRQLLTDLRPIAAKNKTLKRGVKEVVKSLRKSPQGAVKGAAAPGVVVLAADISPMDVISHIPVLCEDHNVPYIFVTSRAELGAAGNTKRPTSVVMVSKTRAGAKKDEKLEGEEEFEEVYNDLVKLVEKESRNVRV
jgi:H/ACA ribonucleoprotein complex subunit 2